MTLIRRSLALCAFSLAALAAPLPPLAAQNVKPVAVVSIANVERNLADIVYLTQIVGMEDTGKTAQLFGNALTAGMDKTRPSGLLILPSGTDFQAVAFIPVTNLKLLLEVHKEQVGEPKDIGGSILEIGTDRKAFIKEQAGWAFVAERKELLSVVPADPTQLLGDMPSKYNIAGRVFVQNIPAELRKMAIDQIKAGMEAATKAQPMQAGQPNPAQTEAMMKIYTQQFERLINDSEEVTAGVAVNAAGKSVNLEFSLTAKDGTDLAKRMALQMNLKSSFAGIALPEAAFSAVGTAQLTEADLAQAKAMVKVQREQMMQQVEMFGTNFTPEQKEALKKLLGRYLDLMEQSSSTRQDGGFAVVLAPSSFSAVAGGFVPDDAAVDAVVKEFADFVKANPNPSGATMEFTMNAGTLGDLKLHRGSMAVNQQDATNRAIFGEKLDFVIASGKNSIYVAVGKDYENVLKKAIDRSSSQAGQPAQPFQMTVSVLPILKFSQSVDPENPLTAGIFAGLIASLEQEGGDKLLITGAAGSKSMTYRVEVQEGIIRTIGEASKMFSAQFNAGLPQ
jgi:hypothetical protein